MADVIVLNPGLGGESIGADNVGGIMYQRCKLVWGIDGAADDATETNPLPVQVMAPISDLSGALNCIETEHERIHEGSFYRCEFQKDMASAGTSVFSITTPDTTTWCHFRLAVDIELESRIQLFENPTSITGGSAATPHNGNRNIADGSVMTCLTDPTVVVGAAIPLGDQVLGSGKTTGGGAQSNLEWVLKRNTGYAIIVTNNGEANNQCNIRTQWYERVSIA